MSSSPPPSEPLSTASLSSTSSSPPPRPTLRVRALRALRPHISPDGATALARADASLHTVLAEGVDRLRAVEAANDGLRALVRARDADVARLEHDVAAWRSGAEVARLRAEVRDLQRRCKKADGEFRVAEAAGVAAREEVGDLLRGNGLQEAGGARGRMRGVGGGGVKQQKGGTPVGGGGREGRSWSMGGAAGGRRVLGGIENLGGRFRQLSFGTGKAGDRDSGRSSRSSRNGRAGG